MKVYHVFLIIVCFAGSSRADESHADECSTAYKESMNVSQEIGNAESGQACSKHVKTSIGRFEPLVKNGKCTGEPHRNMHWTLCSSHDVCGEHEKARMCYHDYVDKHEDMREVARGNLKKYQVKFIVRGANGSSITDLKIWLNNNTEPEVQVMGEPGAIEIAVSGEYRYEITVPGYQPYIGRLSVSNPPQYQVVTVNELVISQSISVAVSTGYLLAYSPTHGSGNELLFHGPSSGVNFMDNGVKSSLMCSTSSPCSYVEDNQADVPEIAHAPLPVQVSLNYHRDRWAFGLLGIYSHELRGSHWSLAGAGRLAYDIWYGKNLAGEVGIVIGGGSATNVSRTSGGEKRFLHGLDGKYLVVNSEVELEKNLGNMFIGFDFGLHFIREERFSVFGKLQPTLWLGVPEFKQSNLNWGVVLPILLGIEFDLWGSGGARSKNR